MSAPIVLVSGDFVLTGGMDRANHALASYLLDRGREVHFVSHRVDPGVARASRRGLSSRGETTQFLSVGRAALESRRAEVGAPVGESRCAGRGQRRQLQLG